MQIAIVSFLNSTKCKYKIPLRKTGTYRYLDILWPGSAHLLFWIIICTILVNIFSIALSGPKNVALLSYKKSIFTLQILILMMSPDRKKKIKTHSFWLFSWLTPTKCSTLYIQNTFFPRLLDINGIIPKGYKINCSIIVFSSKGNILGRQMLNISLWNVAITC